MRRRAGRLALTFAAAALPVADRAAAQATDTIPGVELGLLYDGLHRPTVALAPFAAVGGAESAATQAEAIVHNDLGLSDRFDVMDRPPPVLLSSTDIDYLLWDRYSVDYVVRARVEAEGEGRALALEVHDVVYRRLLALRRVPLPAGEGADFRMAVHRASDAVVEAVFDEPGMAATRIAFSMRSSQGTKDLYVVDSDGENLRRLAAHDLSIISPAWRPDAQRIAFNSMRLDGVGLYELDLRTGAERRLPAFAEGQPSTPVYLPDGQRLAATFDVGGSSRIVVWDIARGCCAEALTDARSWQDVSPAFSPDGRWMAFTSNRLGIASPLVYVRPTAGREVRMIAPFVMGESADFTAPDWSPLGGRVAYHGRIGRGSYQILVTDVDDEGEPTATRQITSAGWNEAPSWAPDGRHLVFTGERPEGSGVFVIDTATGRLRRLVGGRDVTTPVWSPPIRPR